MNYFVPPQGVPQMPTMQGVPGLVQMGQMGQMGQMHQMLQPSHMQLAAGGMTPQVVAPGTHHQLHMVPQHLQHHVQPGLMTAPRVVPVQQAQLQQLIAVSQYQQQVHLQQALRQQSLQRAITSVSVASHSSRPTVITPKTPPTTSVIKPECVDAEVQTPECDANPEADSSTKARIIKPTLLCCSNIVSSEYRQLQSRILTWGEQNDRQALEVTRVKADISPDDSSAMPATTASVIIMDDRNLQFNVCGKVVQSCVMPEKEDSQLDEQKLREYVDLLGDNYSFCHGLSDTDLESIGALAVVKCDNLVQRQVPVSGAYAVTCTRWCKVAEGNEETVRCEECIKAFEILSKKENNVELSVAPGKRPAPLCHDDLPTEPCKKRPRLLEVNAAKIQLDTICEQMVEFQNSASDDESIKNFLEKLGNDLQQIRGLYQEVEMDVTDEESKEQPEGEATKNNDEAELTSESPIAETEEPIDEDALLNGTEENGTENGVEEEVVTKAPVDGEGKQQPVKEEENVSIVNGDGESKA